MFVVASWSKAPPWLIPSPGTALRGSAEQSTSSREGVPTLRCRLCVEAVFALRCQLGVKRPGRDHGLVGSQQWVPSIEGKSPRCPLQACRSHSSEGVAGLWSPAMQWSPAPSSGMGVTSCPATLGKKSGEPGERETSCQTPKNESLRGMGAANIRMEKSQILGAIWRSPSVGVAAWLSSTNAAAGLARGLGAELELPKAFLVCAGHALSCPPQPGPAPSTTASLTQGPSCQANRSLPPQETLGEVSGTNFGGWYRLHDHGLRKLLYF